MKPAEIPHFNGGPRSIAENQFPSHIPSPLLDYRNTKYIGVFWWKGLKDVVLSWIEEPAKNGVSKFASQLCHIAI